MKLILKQHPQLINHSLKVISLIFGYFFWLILANTQPTQISFDIPIYFYGLKDNFEIDSPEKLKITLSGKRLNLCNIDTYQIAAHFDISNYTASGEYKINVSTADFFLHKDLKVINYFPRNFVIKIKEKNS